ncbi:gliding motility-associated C-terminal domain-containing protein [Aridibaculum aurantiacum]|uniref:T9SS type B sorting domain-containing protein n=1 Tax=Aridibaculum aurantiacum TaxID=2810307 RepID=UPI001A971DF4|nr:gliding motility-associated C-terminal domain-containing protein [Aridibaculum aurantiacum]
MRVSFFLPFLLFISFTSWSQCTNPINTFPHFTNFEANNGNWTTGGIASDWTYGTPAKQIISRAASGTRCWIAGGLSATSYNNGENSWLMSPCYDFSTLTLPVVSFSIFWETENRWDGASLQYSIDGGNTWVRAGSVNDSSKCETENWFNHPNINGVGHGWSGSIKPTSGSCLGGGGSGEWVKAQNTFPALAGRSSVRFRFTFTAGTTCNNFDGFAIDDWEIKQYQPVTASFTSTCLSANTVAFEGVDGRCAINHSWNFGDPASGAANTATGVNPTHLYAAPGTYTVSYTTTILPGGPSTVTSIVTILQANTQVVSPIQCFGESNGVAQVNITGGRGPYFYQWNTSPAQTTPQASGLAAGTYDVTVSAQGACTAQASVTLQNPQPLSRTVNVTNSTCGLANGAASVTVSGGTAPYTYHWLPTGGTGSSANNLAPGNYQVQIKDANGCTQTANIQVQNSPALAVNFSNVNHAQCNGANNGSATANVAGGSGGYTYTWSPTGGNSASAVNLPAGTYTVSVTDAAGCTGSGQVVINQPAAIQTQTSFTHTTCANNNGTAAVAVTGGTAPYDFAWSPGGATTSAINGLAAGKYVVTVTDEQGCIAKDSVVINPSTKPTITGVAVTDINCYGQTTGAASASVSGGVTPYTYVWKSGTQSSNAASLQNAAAGDYQLLITDAAGCKDSSSFNIAAPPAMIIDFTASNTTCGFHNGSAAATVNGGVAPYSYQWNTGSTATAITGLRAGTYTFSVIDANGCTFSKSQEIASSVPLQVSLGGDTTVCPGSPIVLRPGAYATFLWSDGSTNATLEISTAGTYGVTVTSAEGCVASDSIVAKGECREIVFPTAFTPNGDGKNDFFRPLGTLSALSGYKLIVYNRWGQVVFQTNDPNKGWNGRFNSMEPPTGVYVWVAEYSFSGQPKKVLKGTILLMK